MQERGIHKQEKKEESVLEMVISSFEVDSITPEGYYPVFLHTSRGVVSCRYYAAQRRDKAVIFIGGEEGGWNTPMRSILYPRLCSMLSRKDINCLRIQYRHPLDMAECMLDTLAGITFLAQEGVDSIGLVGYSQGASIAIQTAAASSHISTVVAISPRAFGFNSVTSFRPDQSMLLLHGSQDTTASVSALSLLYTCVRSPKKIIFYSGAHKNLDEVTPEASRTVRDWLEEHM